MECSTFDRIESGEMIQRPKKKFDTLDKAIEVAKYENSKSEHLSKVVAYKCSVCHKYHIGRNGKTLTQKERDKRTKEINQSKRLKIVGKIDLSSIKY
jgi:hypothetical protein